MKSNETNVIVFADKSQKLSLGYRINENQNKLYDMPKLIRTNFKGIKKIQLHIPMLKNHQENAQKNIGEAIKIINDIIEKEDESQHTSFSIHQNIYKLEHYISLYHKKIGELHFSEKENMIIFRLHQSIGEKHHKKTSQNIKQWPYNTHNEKIFSDIIALINENPQKLIDLESYNCTIKADENNNLIIEENSFNPIIKSVFKFIIKNQNTRLTINILKNKQILQYHNIKYDRDIEDKILKTIEQIPITEKDLTNHDRIDILSKIDQEQYHKITNIIKIIADIQNHQTVTISPESLKKFFQK